MSFQDLQWRSREKFKPSSEVYQQNVNDRIDSFSHPYKVVTSVNTVEELLNVMVKHWQSPIGVLWGWKAPVQIVAGLFALEPPNQSEGR